MQSKYIWWVACRQIASAKGNGLSFMTSISILGVGIGVAALVVVLSVMGGFEQDLRKKMFRGLPHLEVLSTNAAQGFSLKEYPIEFFREKFPSAKGVEPFIQADVIVKKGKNMAPVTLFGIDPQQGGGLWGFSEGMIDGEMLALLGDQISPSGETSAPGLVLGEGLAVQLASGTGDEVVILNPQTSASSVVSGDAISETFQVSGLFRSDLPRYDTKYVVVSLKQARKFLIDYDPSLDEKDIVSGVAMDFQDPNDIVVYESQMKSYPDLTTLTWKDVNKSLLFALQLEKFTMGSILLLIVLVAAFSISGTMMMTVFHKRSQVALLSSLGMSRSEILKLYLMQGFTIGLLGNLLGLILGIGVCVFLVQFQFVDLPLGLYYQKKLPVKFLPLEYGIISLSALLLSLIASAYPAVTAAKQDPGIGLRYM